ncbi:MAG: D-glycerate dehydrogenase [Gemmatimonadota bacterium]
MPATAKRPVVIVTRRLPDAVESRLQELFDVRLNDSDRPFSAEELAEAMGTADGVLCTVSDPITAAIFAGGSRVRILANFGVGYNHIDVDAARRAGVVVTNTPGVLTEATADIAIALMLMVARRLGEGERELRAGQWSGWRPTHMLASDVAGQILGIVGLGRIGKAVAKRAHAGFGMQVLSYTPRPVSEADAALLGVRQVRTLAELLGAADFVSLHCPVAPETKHLMNLARLRQMKSTAYLINTARGDVVDQEALIRVLEERTIAGAGLDVYEGEPSVPEPLKHMENVVLLPHLGSATLTTREAMGMKAVENLRSYFDSGVAPDRVG